MAKENSTPAYKLDMNEKHSKAFVGDVLRMSESIFGRFINSKYLLPKMEATGYKKNQNDLYPEQLWVIEQEYGSLLKKPFERLFCENCQHKIEQQNRIT